MFIKFPEYWEGFKKIRGVKSWGENAVSIIAGTSCYGGGLKYFELAHLKNGKVCYDVLGDVLGYLTEKQVFNTILKLKATT